MPPSAAGSEATLKDISIWPSAIAIIGTHYSRASVCAPIANSAVMSFQSHISYKAGYQPAFSMIRLGGEQIQPQSV